jgi:hypothetical protein
MVCCLFSSSREVKFSFRNIVCDSRSHTCAQYDIISTNNDMVVWLLGGNEQGHAPKNIFSKKSNLEYDSFSKNLYTKTSYYVQGCMTFRKNEPGHSHKTHGIVCRSKLISDTRVSLGMASNIHKGSFPFRRTKKCVFHFRRSVFFVKRLPKRHFEIGHLA